MQVATDQRRIIAIVAESYKMVSDFLKAHGITTPPSFELVKKRAYADLRRDHGVLRLVDRREMLSGHFTFSPPNEIIAAVVAKAEKVENASFSREIQQEEALRVIKKTRQLFHDAIGGRAERYPSNRELADALGWTAEQLATKIDPPTQRGQSRRLLHRFYEFRDGPVKAGPIAPPPTSWKVPDTDSLARRDLRFERLWSTLKGSDSRLAQLLRYEKPPSIEREPQFKESWFEEFGNLRDSGILTSLNEFGFVVDPEKNLERWNCVQAWAYLSPSFVLALGHMVCVLQQAKAPSLSTEIWKQVEPKIEAFARQTHCTELAFTETTNPFITLTNALLLFRLRNIQKKAGEFDDGVCLPKDTDEKLMALSRENLSFRTRQLETLKVLEQWLRPKI